MRSLRHGRRKPLRKGQELLVNYNVPHYSPLDWMVNLGFVPPERWGPWHKVEPVMPQLRRDGHFDELSTEEVWKLSVGVLFCGPAKCNNVLYGPPFTDICT